jgi:hypothetical protein
MSKNSELKNYTLSEYKPSQKEMVNHPSHYGGEDNPYEAIKVIEAWDLDNDFCLGNVIKYISRAGKKDATIQELEKAKWYLERKITRLKTKQK